MHGYRDKWKHGYMDTEREGQIYSTLLVRLFDLVALVVLISRTCMRKPN